MDEVRKMIPWLIFEYLLLFFLFVHNCSGKCEAASELAVGRRTGFHAKWQYAAAAASFEGGGGCTLQQAQKYAYASAQTSDRDSRH